MYTIPKTNVEIQCGDKFKKNQNPSNFFKVRHTHTHTHTNKQTLSFCLSLSLKEQKYNSNHSFSLTSLSSNELEFSLEFAFRVFFSARARNEIFFSIFHNKRFQTPPKPIFFSHLIRHKEIFFFSIFHNKKRFHMPPKPILSSGKRQRKMKIIIILSVLVSYAHALNCTTSSDGTNLGELPCDAGIQNCVAYVMGDGSLAQSCDATNYCTNHQHGMPEGESCCQFGSDRVACSPSNFNGQIVTATVYEGECGTSPVRCGAAASSVSFVTALAAFVVAFKTLF